MLVRLSPGTIVIRVAASAGAKAYARAASRMRASRAANEAATPPVTITTSGFRPFTTVPSIAPSAWHASSTTAAASASPAAARSNTSRAVIAWGSPAPARPLGDPAPARVDRQTPVPPAPARRTVELDRGVAELAAEAGDAPHQTPVEDDAGAEARARRQHHEPPPAPRPPPPPPRGGATHVRDQPEQRRERAAGAFAVGRRAPLDEDLAVDRHRARGCDRAADVDPEEDGHHRSPKWQSVMPSAATAARAPPPPPPPPAGPGAAATRASRTKPPSASVSEERPVTGRPSVRLTCTPTPSRESRSDASSSSGTRAGARSAVVA